MRNRFGEWLADNAKKNDNLILLSGDIGFGIFDEFRKSSPAQFLNCGIAEQNMIGTAAGLAAKGFLPFVYTIIPFLLYRPFEFVRDLIGHQNLPVCLVGVGGGFSYDKLGYTHYAIEDILIAKTLPNFEILTPFDPQSAEKCFSQALVSKRPTYIRLMKGKEPDIPGQFENGMCSLMNTGDDYQIYTYGSIAGEVLKAGQELSKNYNLNGKIFAVWKYSEAKNHIQYLDKNSFFIEEHISPGLFQGISDPINKALYVNRDQSTKVGSREKILAEHGLSSDEIVKYFVKQISK